MGILKRYIILIFVLSVAVFVTHCSKKSEERIIKIGVSDVNSKGRFQMYIEEGMRKHQETLGGKVEVVYLDAKEDVEKQVDQVEYFIREGMDAVVVIPVSTDVKNTRIMTELTGDSEIPIVYVNKFPDEFNESIPEHAYYIGSQEKVAGIMQMEYLAERLNGNGNVAILMGDLSSSRATFERTEGVEEEAGKYPGIKIVEKRVGNWLKPMAASVVEDWLSAGKEIDAIIANNDEMALGAIQGLKKHYAAGKVMVLGIDATPEAVTELKTGKLTATVLQDAKAQGKGAIEIALKAVKKEPVQNISWIPFKLVTQENYEEILNKN